MPLHRRYPEPDEFKVDATHTSRVSCSKAGIHSKYAERIRRYKYRQGYRLTGEHLRDSLIINDIRIVANQSCATTVNFTFNCVKFMQSIVIIQQNLQRLLRWFVANVRNAHIAVMIYSLSALLASARERP